MREADPSYDPHKALWQAVLQRQVDDALSGPQGILPSNSVGTIKAARRYLTSRGKGLDMVCTLAGLDPQAVVEAMRIRIAAAPSPEHLAQHHRHKATKPPRTPKPKRPPPEARTITIDGETKSLAEWCSLSGVKVATAYGRLNAGWNPAEAVTLSTADARRRSLAQIKAHHARQARQRPGFAPQLYTHNGMFLSVPQWAAHLGMSASTIRQRLASGWSVSQALTPGDNRCKGGRRHPKPAPYVSPSAQPVTSTTSP